MFDPHIIYDFKAACGIPPLLYFEYRISNKEFRTAEVLKAQRQYFHFDILRFLILRFCGSYPWLFDN